MIVKPVYEFLKHESYVFECLWLPINGIVFQSTLAYYRFVSETNI